MSFCITKTIPPLKDIEGIDMLLDESRQKIESHMAE
jgi:hypothetical protein